MSVDLRFDPSKFVRGAIMVSGVQIPYRFYENIPYVSRPNAPELQMLNLYVPEVLAEDHSAPIYLLQRTGGMGECRPYTIEQEQESLAGAQAFEAQLHRGPLTPVGKNESYQAATDEWRDSTRGFIPRALAEGYVFVSPGARGRESVVNGVYVGRGALPMSIIDLKAAVRYLRYNKGLVPGDTDKIIMDGTSSGGGMSALLGATGNSRRYERFLSEIGAADARDDVFCAVVNSPITDFAHIDLAYEWMFRPELVDGLFADDATAAAMNRAMAERYMDYVNSLSLTHPETGAPLGFGAADSYTPYLTEQLNRSATVYLASLSEAERAAWLSQPHNRDVLTWDGQRAELCSPGAFIRWNSGRWMRYIGCFDGFDSQPSRENQAFGTADGKNRHFSAEMGEIISAFPGWKQAGARWLADAQENAEAVYLLDPLNFIGTGEKADLAPLWYLRCGAHHETTLNLFLNLLLRLKNHTNACIDAHYSWTMRHTAISNIQPDETFAFLNAHCKG
ncbi:MAG: hypothetical protein LUG25_05085 [Oscillospiraceae bacterium]|nr:hypothetical protein [Oscillospiraceae bacterium]